MKLPFFDLVKFFKLRQSNRALDIGQTKIVADLRMNKTAPVNPTLIS